MFLRSLIIGLVLVPAAALAQTTGDQLSPASDNTGGPSQNSSAVLQPADPQTLQSADVQDGGASQSASDDNLQTAGTSNELNNYLSGEIDGQAEAIAEEDSTLYFWVMMGLTAAGALWLLLDRQQLTG